MICRLKRNPLDQFQAGVPTEELSKARAFLPRRARQPVWSGLDVGGWINAILLYSI